MQFHAHWNASLKADHKLMLKNTDRIISVFRNAKRLGHVPNGAKKGSFLVGGRFALLYFNSYAKWLHVHVYAETV